MSFFLISILNESICFHSTRHYWCSIFDSNGNEQTLFCFFNFTFQTHRKNRTEWNDVHVCHKWIVTITNLFCQLQLSKCTKNPTNSCSRFAATLFMRFESDSSVWLSAATYQIFIKYEENLHKISKFPHYVTRSLLCINDSLDFCVKNNPNWIGPSTVFIFSPYFDVVIFHVDFFSLLLYYLLFICWLLLTNGNLKEQNAKLNGEHQNVEIKVMNFESLFSPYRAQTHKYLSKISFFFFYSAFVGR